jgi:phosphomannomutase
MAAAAGVSYAESFTGFKWIAEAVRRRPDKRLVFAYEQALGYLVAARPLDKDGITAAIVMCELVAALAAEGRDLLDQLEDIASRFGRHVTAERSVAMPPAAAAAAVDRLRNHPPAEIAGREVVSVEYLPEATLIRIVLRGRGGDASIRLQVRPSGTEPKVKLYGEAVDEDPTPYLDELGLRIE